MSRQLPVPAPMGRSHPSRPTVLIAIALASVLVIGIVLYIILPWLFPPPFTGVVNYATHVSAINPTPSLAGLSYQRLQVNVTSSAPVRCTLMFNQRLAHDGACASFYYVYKTRSSISVEATVSVALSFQRNQSDADVTVELAGEVQSAFAMSGFVEVGRRPESVMLAVDYAEETSPVRKRFVETNSTTVGAPRSYRFNATREFSLNLTASASVTVEIKEETTTVVYGDCRNVYVSTWLKRSATVEVEFEVEVTFESEDPVATVTYTLTVEGPGLERTA